MAVDYDELARTVAGLTDGETDTIEGMVSTATFYDPDGNALMLAQDLTQGG